MGLRLWTHLVWWNVTQTRCAALPQMRKLRKQLKRKFLCAVGAGAQPTTSVAFLVRAKVLIHKITEARPCDPQTSNVGLGLGAREFDSCKAAGLQLKNSARSCLWTLALPWRCKGIGGALQLLKHFRSDSKLDTFLQIGLRWTRLHAGVSFPILETTCLSLPHLEKGWFPATRELPGSIDASIHIPATVLPNSLVPMTAS